MIGATTNETKVASATNCPILALNAAITKKLIKAKTVTPKAK